jgi:hypothetical protein
MIYSQIFHQILYFLSEKNDSEKKMFYESFSISENNLISVELAGAVFNFLFALGLLFGYICFL